MNTYEDHKKKTNDENELQEAIVLSSSYRVNEKLPNYYNNSSRCGGETSTSFTYVFPEKIVGVTSMKISSIEVPIDAYFTISEYYGNNTFTLMNNNNSTEILTFTIPDGNYTTNDEYVEVINKLLKDKYNELTENSILGVKSFFYNSDNTNYDISYNTPSECAVYAYTEGMFIYFANINDLTNISAIQTLKNNLLLNFSNANDSNFTYTLGWILGFRTFDYSLLPVEPNIETEDLTTSGPSHLRYTYSPPIINTNVIANEVPANFTPTKSFLISIDDFQHGGHDNIRVAFNNSFLNKRILARIPFIKTKDTNNTFIFNKYSDTPVNIRQYKGPTDISKLKIELLDDLGRIINIFGSDWNFVLTITRTVDKSMN